MSARKRAPAGLGTSGRALWASIVEDFELDQHEVTLLLQACRTADYLDTIAAGLKGAEPTVIGDRGGERAHPLLAEHSRASLTLSRLLASLRLPSGFDGGSAGEGEPPGRPQRRGASRGAYGIRGSVS